MIPRQPRSIRVDSLLPYTTLFRSDTIGDLARLVTEQNRGRLARDGARLTAPEIWRIIQQLAASTGATFPCASRSRVTASSSSRAEMRSEEHTSELQSLMRISYAVFCLKKKNIHG